jgi:hypothetical protein
MATLAEVRAAVEAALRDGLVHRDWTRMAADVLAVMAQLPTGPLVDRFVRRLYSAEPIDLDDPPAWVDRVLAQLDAA